MTEGLSSFDPGTAIARLLDRPLAPALIALLLLVILGLILSRRRRAKRRKRRMYSNYFEGL